MSECVIEITQLAASLVIGGAIVGIGFAFIIFLADL